MKFLLSFLLLISLAIAGGDSSAGRRWVVYYDQWHTTPPPNKDITAGVTHLVMAFADPAQLTSAGGGWYTPFKPMSEVRALFSEETKLCIAIGGWGFTMGFSTASASNDSRKIFADNVAKMVKLVGFDCVDIDWEYPGGNGQDYKENPNSGKTAEIDNFPLLLADIRAALDPHIDLSIAVPGLERDMIAFTAETVPLIVESVDFINVMAYDLMNRRDNATRHHTDFQGSLAAVDRYIGLGAPAEKLNLGFAFYAKYFATMPGAECTSPIGCPVQVLEDPAIGTDTGLSGALTFEKINMPAGGGGGGQASSSSSTWSTWSSWSHSTFTTWMPSSSSSVSTASSSPTNTWWTASSSSTWASAPSSVSTGSSSTSSTAPTGGTGNGGPNACGANGNGRHCPAGTCCSSYGYCGVSEGHCGQGCQPAFGQCGSASNITTPTTSSSSSSGFTTYYSSSSSPSFSYDTSYSESSFPSDSTIPSSTAPDDTSTPSASSSTTFFFSTTSSDSSSPAPAVSTTTSLAPTITHGVPFTTDAIIASFGRALFGAQLDAENGGEWFWDSSVGIFWTWDTPELMVQKVNEIIIAKGLGGAMAWSLGEDSFDYSHLIAIRDALQGAGDIDDVGGVNDDDDEGDGGGEDNEGCGSEERGSHDHGHGKWDGNEGGEDYGSGDDDDGDEEE